MQRCEHEAETIAARLIDISSQGVSLQTLCELAITEKLRINITLQELGMQINLQAAVTWQQQEDNQEWLVGCAIRPQIPKSVLTSLATGRQINRRDSLRAASEIYATAVYNLGDQPFNVILCNYSPGGFCAVMKDVAENDSQIYLCVGDAEAKPKVIHGDVRWVAPLNDGYLVGCAFLDERDFQQLHLACQ